MAISSNKFRELLDAAKKRAATARKEAEVLRAESLITSMDNNKVEEVTFHGTGIHDSSSDEEKIDFLKEVISSPATNTIVNRKAVTEGSGRDSNVSNLPLISEFIRKYGFKMGMVKFREEQQRAKEVAEKTQALQALPLPSPSLSVNNKEELLAPSALASENEETTRTKIGVARIVTLNTKQQSFCDLVVTGNSCILIGAAGTGKTTSMRECTTRLIAEGVVGKLGSGTKYLQIGNYGAAILSFTRKAVNNIRHAVVAELRPHTLTVHKLLEFAPEYFEIEDPAKPGQWKNTMRFAPTRNAFNPLPAQLTFLAFEESSMISTELYALVQEAMPHKHQEVFLGDIQQLPPIFGTAILGFKMLELETVELTEVYRQAAESPIIDLAWKILEGKPEIFAPATESYKTSDGKSRIRVPSLETLSRKVILEDGTVSEVKFQPWQKNLSVDHTVPTVVKQFCHWEETEYYNAQEDVILCPFNKQVGTIEVNKGISQYLGRKRNAIVHEVIAGFNKHYLAVGDRVLFDKEDAFITGIRVNGKYLGKSPQTAHKMLDRWGHIRMEEMTQDERLKSIMQPVDDFNLEAVEAFMEAAASASEDRVQVASHVVELRYAYAEEGEDPIALESAAEINDLIGGYCITVPKFQGSENERVFLLLHHTHAVANCREMLYTAVTRARKFLHIICEKDTFYKGVKTQRIKGNTLKEKAQWFNTKKEVQERNAAALLQYSEAATTASSSSLISKRAAE